MRPEVQAEYDALRVRDILADHEDASGQVNVEALAREVHTLQEENGALERENYDLQEQLESYKAAAEADAEVRGAAEGVTGSYHRAEIVDMYQISPLRQGIVLDVDMTLGEALCYLPGDTVVLSGGLYECFVELEQAG